MKIFLPVLLLIISISLSGKDVPLDVARSAALHFLTENGTALLKSTSSPVLSRVELPMAGNFRSVSKKSTTAGELIYIFNINEDDGFIMISGDDGALPVLGYSGEGTFNPDALPDNFKKWIEDYKKQIRYIHSHPENITKEVREHWESLISGSAEYKKSTTSAVTPLVTSRWDQSPYYNDLCPYDSEAGERTVTGCAATAMAQIMNYWEYPKQGTGFHSYQDENYGVLSANFGSTTYDWASMPDQLTGQNTAVATLMYHCGVSIDMNYGIAAKGGSGAYILIDHSPVTNCVEYALKEYFGYKSSLHGLFRKDYSTSAWVQTLKTELDEGRPVQYAGFGSEGGHTFVCDGYDANNFFHFNWGWDGYSDGYFAVDALDPEGTGIGGGNGGYNSEQQIIIGIEPPEDAIAYDISLYSEVTISEDPVMYTSAFTIHADVANFSTTNFSGDIGMAIFDKDGNFIEFAEIIEGVALGSNEYFDLTFSDPGSVALLPGTYYAEAYYRKSGGNWKVVNNGSYTNRLQFGIYYASDIEVYDDFLISSGNEIYAGEPFNVTTDILNDGTSAFQGDFEIDLYDMEGNYAATVETLTGGDLAIGYFYDNAEFSSTGISIPPGTYLMALLHKPQGGDWELSGSTYHANPVKVIVKAAKLLPDPFEQNNDGEEAYTLDLAYSGNTATVTTEGSSIHTGDDLDFYRLSLEEGYNYSITARIHDSYNSGNGNVYTDDVVWLYYANDQESDVFDDVMDGTIAVQNGGEVLFGVAPFFEGETGTYLMDIRVSRTDITSTHDITKQKVSVYPNPAGEQLNVEAPEVIRRLGIYDIKGRQIISETVDTEKAVLDISGLDAGIYFLHIVTDSHVTVEKIIKP